MKIVTLAMLTFVSIFSQASATDWIGAVGSCEVQSIKKALELVVVPHPREQFGVVARTQRNADGIEALVHDTKAHVAIYLRGRDLNTQLWVPRSEINPERNVHFGSYSKELQSWITCKVSLRN